MKRQKKNVLKEKREKRKKEYVKKRPDKSESVLNDTILKLNEPLN